MRLLLQYSLCLILMLHFVMMAWDFWKTPCVSVTQSVVVPPVVRNGIGK